jgi:5-(aminomethyl)-3-furanmethanol phosphate kinase
MKNTPPILRVVKVGGSLLDWPELPAALQKWLDVQPPALNILLCGCGALGDTIRRADRDFSLGEEVSHWLCVDLLSTTARLLAAIVPAAAYADQFEQLEQLALARNPGNVVFSPREFMRSHEAALPGQPLPICWSVTTDSIAARLAQILSADELVILKSADAANASLSELAQGGHVDANFPVVAALLTGVRIVNLRTAIAPSIPP